MSELQKFGILVLVFPFYGAWAGFMISMNWGWFIVPLGVAPIGVAQALGIFIMSRFFTVKLKKDAEIDLTDYIGTAIIVPATFLAFGYAISRFI